MLILFGLAIFLGAALLFAVQPMAAKAVLPLLGGSPAVWNTAMLFFQTALLAGYAYAHGIGRLRMRVQAPVHAAVVAGGLGLVFLTGGLLTDPPRSAWPVPWLLAWLLATTGPTFFGVASAGPLLQRWFSRTDHPRARDPYFLYAASNAGSFLGLLAYPFVIEPALALPTQRGLWLGGYALFILLIAACGLLAKRRDASALATSAARAAEEPKVEPHAGPRERDDARTCWLRRLRWIALAFVPSSLMLGATTHLTTDVAAVPLLWVVPLSIYLLTFILAFSPRLPLRTAPLGRILVIALLALAVALLLEAKQPLWLVAALHLLVLGVGGLFAHRLLAGDRPGTSRLTEYYLLISVGGALGGLFNGLLAPVLFDRVLEYPITLAALALLLPWRRAGGAPRRGERAAGRAWPFAAAIAGGLLVYLVAVEVALAELGIVGGYLVDALAIGAPAILIFIASRSGLAMGACVLVALGVQQFRPSEGRVLHRERTFFGVHRVERDDDDYAAPAHLLLHGTTLHGLELRGPGFEGRPTGYYHPSGPAGAAFAELHERRPDGYAAALIGLGTGALADYARPADRMVFHEIDPAVVRIAEDPDLFSFLTRARRSGADLPPVVLGDGRLTIAEHPEGSLDLVLVDAFSSDAIPVHLLTLEAVEIYLSRLAPDGLLVIHVSNQYLDLEPVVAAAAEALGLEARIWRDILPDERDPTGRVPSTWVVLARDAAALGGIGRSVRWFWLNPQKRVRPWTDERSDIWSVFDLSPVEAD